MAALFGVSYRTLRFYEQKGLLEPARCGTLRLYSDKDRLRLGVIALAKRLGFSLLEVRKLIESRAVGAAQADDTPTSVASLGLSREEICARIERLARDRDSVQSAIEELRKVAHDPSADHEPKAVDEAVDEAIAG